MKKNTLNTLMEKLQILSEHSENPVHRRDVKSVLDFYIRNGKIPRNKTERIKELIEYNEDIIKPMLKPNIHLKEDRFYLYAVSDGDFVKIGYTNNINRRLLTLQTGQPRKLELLWKTFCAVNQAEARKQEKHLHKLIKKHKVKGEWYYLSCMDKVYSHVVRNQESKEEKLAEKINKTLDQEAMLGLV